MEKFVAAVKRLDKKQSYVLACSYGPDSMCLFDLLLRNDIDFVVAHVNYHRRPEANQETKDLRAYCDEKKVPFYLKNVKYRTTNGNFQAWARERRYQFFKEVCQCVNTDSVLMAHQEDDVIETYIMQKQRNSDVFNYGILARSSVLDVNIIRPLLGFSKLDIIQYCKDHNVPFAIDSSNTDTKYTRNRIRADVVSKLTIEQRKGLLQEICLLNESLVKRKEELANQFSPFTIVSASAVEELNSHDKYFVMYRVVTRAIPPRKFNPPLYKSIERMIASKKPNASIKLTSNIHLIKEYGSLYIANLKKIKPYSIQVRSPQVVHTDYFKADLKFEMPHRNLSYDDWPITIRSFKSGDVYEIGDYRTQVRRLFIDWKVPSVMRAVWPIVTNKEGKIIYIPRYNRDYDTRKDTDFMVYFPHIEQ